MSGSSQNSTMNRAALGSIASLGDLYDARTDKFCGVSAFDGNLPKECVSSVGSNFSNILYAYTDDLSEKLTTLNVSAELSASFLGGFVTVSGSGHYLNDKKTSTRSTSSSLVYNITTVTDSLNVMHNDLLQIFSADSFKLYGATHIVVGINWGANTVLSCQYQNHLNKDRRAVEGSLSAQIQAFVCQINGHADIHMDDFSNQEFSNFKLKMYGDILPGGEELPTTVAQAVTFMKSVPKLVSSANSGKGVPLSYTLLPISNLLKHLDAQVTVNTVYNSIETDLLTAVIQAMTDFDKAQNKLNDFYTDTTEMYFCIDPKVSEACKKLKAKLAGDISQFRAQLAPILTGIRSGAIDVKELAVFLSKYVGNHDSNLTPESIEKQLEVWQPYQDKMQMAKQFIGLGAVYIGSGSSPTRDLLRALDNPNFVLYFDQVAATQEPERWLKNEALFLRKLMAAGNKDEKGPVGFVIDCEFHPNKQILGDFHSIILQRCGDTVIVEDMLKHDEYFKTTPLVEYKTVLQRLAPVPPKAEEFKFPCIGGKDGCDPTLIYSWTCSVCKTKIFYGDDQKCVYCKCGCLALVDLTYHCPDPKHGLEFRAFDASLTPGLLAQIYRDDSPVRWESAANGFLPANAVCAGNENGRPAYIVRGLVKSVYYAGMLVEGRNFAEFFTDNDPVVQLAKYEVLVAKPGLLKFSCLHNGLPSQKYSVDDSMCDPYLARALYKGCLVPGWYFVGLGAFFGVCNGKSFILNVYDTKKFCEVLTDTTKGNDEESSISTTLGDDFEMIETPESNDGCCVELNPL